MPVPLPVGRTATAVSAGYAHTCAVLDNGSLICWGQDLGQLGDDLPAADQTLPVAVALASDRHAVAVAAGGSQTCVIFDDGGLGCFGLDGFNQLGNGTAATTEAVAATAPAALVAGSTHARVADLTLTHETVPGALSVGAGAVVTVRVTNTGPDAATNLRVRTVRDLVSVTPLVVGQGTVDARIWSIGTLAPGASGTLIVTLRGIGPGNGGLESDVASLDAHDATPATATNTITITGGILATAAGCTIIGTAGPDRITGTNLDDIICSLAGNDRITSRGGDDLILAGNGNDIVSSGAGDDIINAGTGTTTQSAPGTRSATRSTAAPDATPPAPTESTNAATSNAEPPRGTQRLAEPASGSTITPTTTAREASPTGLPQGERLQSGRRATSFPQSRLESEHGARLPVEAAVTRSGLNDRELPLADSPVPV